MIIQDALKETGKATLPNKTGYVADNNGCLKWFDEYDNYSSLNTLTSEVLSNNWRPYYDKSQIRPQEVGELWKHVDYDIIFATIIDFFGELSMVYLGDLRDKRSSKIIHGQDGWSRIYPPIEENQENK